MAKKNDISKGVYGVSIEERNKQLANNLGKYPLYNEELTPGIGEMAEITDKVKKPTSMGKGGLLRHTVSNKDAYGKRLNEFYDRDADKLEIYQSGPIPNKVSPLYNSSYDYAEYMDELNRLSWDRDFINKLSAWDESLADIAGVLDFTIGDGSQSIFQSLFDNRTYGSMMLTLEPTRVGIVRNYSVADALAGGIITNINNWGMGRDTKVGEIISKTSKAIFGSDMQEGNGLSGKDTALGVYSSALVGKALHYASQFNTIRNTQYITPDLNKIYGLNTYTIHNFSYLLRVDDLTGEANYVEDGKYINAIDELYTDKGNANASVRGDNGLFNRRNQDYIRYKNVFENANELYSTENNREYLAGVIRHKLYTPFEQYMGGEWGKGYSIEASHNDIDTPLRKYNNEYFFNEPDGNKRIVISPSVSQYNTNVGTYEPTTEGGTLLAKTAELYKNNKIGSLVARFHTSFETDATHNESTQTQSAITEKYGMSRGRNLLKKTPTKENEYDNPYCRVWTYHHQYKTYQDTIRPFSDENGNPMTPGELQNNWDVKMRTDEAGKRMDAFSVLNKNGLVNIAPTNDKTEGIDVKRCMFSIENLAWKDVNKWAYMNDVDRILSPEQIGPNGGRIMWFPPYDLTFSENVTADWEGTPFIGRGENVYTYKNTQRTGQLDFTILVDHPSIVDSWGLGVKNKEEDEQTLLRFFAGCETLDPRNATREQVKQSEVLINADVISDTILEDSEEKSFAFNVYFPNDFSGRRSGVTGTQVIQYLLFGNTKQFAVDGNNISKYRGYEMRGGDTLDSVYGYKTQGITEGVSATANAIDTTCGYVHDNKPYGKHADMGSVMLNREMTYLTDNRFGHLSMNEVNYTLTDMFMAIEDGSEAQKTYLEAMISDESKQRIAKLKELLNNDKVQIQRIEYTGFASKRHNTDRTTIGGSNGITNNGELIKYRAKNIQNWLMNTNDKFKNIEHKLMSDEYGGVQGELNTRDALESSYDEKRNRRTEVRVFYKIQSGGAVIDETVQLLNNASSRVDNNLSSQGTNIVDALSDLGRQEQYVSDARNFAESSMNKINSSVRKVTNTAIQNGSYRYDYEKEYFSNVQTKDPLTYDKIVDKIKYFSPAFHSITPEGFNARLTFLHQCTRQGHTIGATSDGGGWGGHSAGNLAFGRPPVCVLRIGDFYNTKILITSFNISYDDGVQWDMNPEGIGLQPMRCKVSLGITFLGGSDLEAPVARLQNAVSFNYYANTSLYDNRSDVTRYSAAKEDSEYARDPWVPTPKAYK